MKKISGSFFILSLILVFFSYDSMQESLLIAKANKLSKDKKYEEADKIFEKLNSNNSSKNRNRGINLYKGKKYEKFLKINTDQNFLRGNSNVYLGEGEREPKKILENYEKALEEYKNAMKISGDINIKKNYEIINKRIEDIKEKEKKQSNQNQNQNQKNSNKNQKDQQDKDKSQESSNNNSQNNKSQNNANNNMRKKENDSNQKKNSTDKQNTSQNDKNQKGNKNSNGEKKENKKNKNSESRVAEKTSTHRKEALSILESLEGNEEQAFKNNERLEYTGGETTNEAW